MLICGGVTAWVLSLSKGMFPGGPPPRRTGKFGGYPGAEAIRESARQYKLLRIVGTVAVMVGAIVAVMA